MNGARPNFVVDGSNIATEGRSLPSLAQLDDAVTALLAEYEIESLTVVVDATFAHRIDASERTQYDEALEAGELIAPPAGTVGRGDAFILQVAERAEATVFSNDSFQEFHGEYPWLFDADRLLGGKPVSGIGWIFIKRIPVRGPKSRQSGAKSRRGKSKLRTKGKTSQRPAPATDIIDDITSGKRPSGSGKKKSGSGNKRKAKAPSGRRKKNKPNSKQSAQPSNEIKKAQKKRRRDNKSAKSAGVEKSNDARSFLEFVSTYSIGDIADCVVERFASHGCYAKTGSAICYLPSRSMGDPAPAKARDVVSIGQALRVKVVSYDPSRRGINVALESVGRKPKNSRSKVPNHPKNVSQSKNSKTSAQERQVLADGPSREPNLTRSNIVAKKKTAKKKAKKKVAKKVTTKSVAKASSSTRAKRAVAKKKATKKVAKKKAPARKKATKKVAKKKAPARKKKK